MSSLKCELSKFKFKELFIEIMIDKKNIILIGGAGYIGTVMAINFIKLGYKVTVVDNLIYNQNTPIFLQNFDNFEFINCDIFKYAINPSLVTKNSNIVILAGLVGDPITKKYPSAHDKINIQSIKSIVNNIKDINFKNLIFISTCSNYGILKNNEIANENTELSPLSLYAKAKVEIENFINDTKLNSRKTILRFATAFGISPRMRFDLTLNEFVRNLFFQKYQEVYDEHTWRPYCHVSDFFNIINLIINDDNEWDTNTFNVGSDKNNYTKKMICEAINKYIKGSKIEYLPGSDDPRDYRVSFDKINNYFNYKSFKTIDYGIKEIIDALKLGFFHKSIQNYIDYGNYVIDENLY